MIAHRSLMNKGQTLQMQEFSRMSLIADMDDRSRIKLVHIPLHRDSAAATYVGANRNFKVNVLPKMIGGGEKMSLARCCARSYCLQAQHHVPNFLASQ